MPVGSKRSGNAVGLLNVLADESKNRRLAQGMISPALKKVARAVTVCFPRIQATCRVNTEDELESATTDDPLACFTHPALHASLFKRMYGVIKSAVAARRARRFAVRSPDNSTTRRIEAKRVFAAAGISGAARHHQGGRALRTLEKN
jgi:hypothetical protein